VGVQAVLNRKICFMGMASCLCLIFTGCVAQQADVQKMNRDLNKKIAQLDRSKKSLQQAVREANKAMEEANSIIAQQREEIDALLQARAELDDQMATLKEGDLTEVRGDIDENRHHLETLTEEIMALNSQVLQSQEEAKARDEAIKPIVDQLQARDSQQENVVTTQAEKITEFRASLLDFQQALTTMREKMVQQERLVQQANLEIEQVSRKQQMDNQSTNDNFGEVKRSINSVVMALRKVSGTLAERLDEQDRKLYQVSSRLGGSPMSSAASGEITPSAQTNEINRSVSQLQQEVDRLAVKRTPQGNTRQAARDPIPSSTAERPAALQPQAPSDHAMRDYQQQYALLRAGNLDGAINGFNQFIQRYPSSPLAGNAQYWLGECYYAQRNFSQAILEFERVYNQYPSSEKVPAALLKIGYSNLELEKPATARSIFRQIVRSYPKSPEAAKAYARLTETDRTPKSSS
jgi:tol-pal system protein YbgF